MIVILICKKLEKSVRKSSWILIAYQIIWKNMTFMLGKHIVFIDSMRFMATSLDNLTKSMPEEAFKYT